MMEAYRVWKVRFKLAAGGYSVTRISCKGDELSRDEVEQWADGMVRLQDQYAAVDEVCPLEELSADVKGDIDDR